MKVKGESFWSVKLLNRKNVKLKMESITCWGASAPLLFTQLCDLLLLLRMRWVSHVLRKGKLRIMQETSVASEEHTHSAKSRRRKQYVIKITRHNIPEDTNTDTNHCENLKISHRQTHCKLKLLSCN